MQLWMYFCYKDTSCMTCTSLREETDSLVPGLPNTVPNCVMQYEQLETSKHVLLSICNLPSLVNTIIDLNPQL